MNEPELVQRWLRHSLRGYVQTYSNRQWVRRMERDHSYVVLQENLWQEAQELGVVYSCKP